MYPISHAATALVLREKFQLSRTWFLLLAVQFPGLLLAALYFAGFEHSLRYSSFLVGVIGLGSACWLVLNKVLHRKTMCWAFVIGVISYVVLDMFTPDIPVAPFSYKPLWLNLYSSPMLAMAVEISYGILCWHLCRGRRLYWRRYCCSTYWTFPLFSMTVYRQWRPLWAGTCGHGRFGPATVNSGFFLRTAFCQKAAFKDARGRNKKGRVGALRPGGD